MMRIKASIYILLSYILVCGQTVAFAADSAALLPNAKQTFLDNSGRPLSAGKVYFYLPNTTTNKTTWQDATKSVANSNPITLDAAGRATIYGDGSYRQIVKTSAGSLVWDSNTASTGSGGDSGSGDGIAVGTILATSNLTAPANYLFAYGQEVSRTTYSVLYAAITTSQTVTCASGSPTASGFSDTTQVPVGAVIESTCFSAGTTVLSKTSTTVTFSNNSSLSTTDTIRLFSYGNGNGSTTFNLPDLRGYTVAGRTNMGGTASSNLTSTYFGSNPQATGGIGGSQSKTLLTANLPAYTPAGTNAVVTGSLSGTIAAVVTDPGHTHLYTSPTVGANQNSGGATGTATNIPTVNGATSASSVTGISATTNLATGVFTGSAPAFTGTAQGGTSTAFALVQPTLTLNYIIKVLPDTSSGGSGSGSGTVTSVTCGTGMTGGTITTSGQCDVTYGTSAATAAVGNDTRITGAAQKASNLSDLASAATARTNLGLATIASSASAADLTTGNLLIARFNSGTSASNTTYWRGDGTWSTPAGAGTVTSIATGTGLTGGPITTSGTILLASIANNTVLGNVSGSTATPIALTTTQLTALVNAMVGDSGSGGTKGAVPAPASGDTAAGKFLKADGTWAVPPGSGSSGVTSLGAMTGVIGCGSGITCATATVSLTAPVTLALGGTNNTGLTASNGGLVYSDASKLNVLAGTATAGQIPRSGTSTAPSWSTMVYPNTIGINEIPYANAANNLSAMTAAAGGLVNTSATNVPTITATPTLGVAGSSAGKITLSGSTSGTATIQTAAVAGSSIIFQLPTTNGTAGQFLSTAGSGVTSWTDSPSGAAVVTCLNTAGDSALIQAALDTGRTVFVTAGDCNMTTALTISFKGQILMGAGRYRTKFNYSTIIATGSIICNTAEPGPTLRDFGMYFTQPDTTNRASLTAYNPAIYCIDTARFNFRDLRISRAMVGIQATGNIGGSYIDNVEMSAFTYGLNFDGALDTVRVVDFHFWPFDLTSNQTSIFTNVNTTGLRSGRVDDLIVTGGLFLSGTQMTFYSGTGGDTFANIANTDFDTFLGINLIAGTVTCASCSFTNSRTTDGYSITQSGGTLILSGAYFFSSAVFVNSATANFTLSSSVVDMGANDYAWGALFNGTYLINGTKFNRTANTTYTNETIHVLGGSLTATGNRSSTKGTGTGKWLTLDVDNYHSIVGNMHPGWTSSCPAAVTNVYSANGTSGC